VNHQGISVVIPNYNGRKLFDEVIPSLLTALHHSGRPYEIIVSDDASTDGSVEFLHANYPECIVLANERNQGFSPTINRGIFSATQHYILLLNSDVKLEEHYFNSLFRYFDKADTFGVMGKIIGWNDDQVQDAGKYPSFHGAKIKTSGNYLPLQTTHEDWWYSMYLSGANAFVSREKIMQLGGFDELFAPFYIEDVELSVRAWRAGWKCYFDNDAVCRHQLSVSIRSKNKKAFINTVYYRNKMYLHAMHLTGASLAFWYLQLVPETLLRVLTGKFWYLSSLRAFFQHRTQMKRSQQRFRQSNPGKELLTVQQVTHTITAPLEGIVIKRF
jgi:GT2 family glycosyltransferase